jgi:hypothetical protein
MGTQYWPQKVSRRRDEEVVLKSRLTGSRTPQSGAEVKSQDRLTNSMHWTLAAENGISW